MSVVDHISNFLYCVSAFCILIIIVYLIIRKLEEFLVFDIHHPIVSTLNLIYGSKYIVKVNGVWSVCRGKQIKRGSLRGWLNIKYGPDKHKWRISYTDWKCIDEWSEEDIERRVVEYNIKELKKTHPYKKEKFVVNDDWSFIECCDDIE